MRKIALVLGFSLALLPAYRAKACGGGNYNHGHSSHMTHDYCDMHGMYHSDNNHDGMNMNDNYKNPDDNDSIIYKTDEPKQKESAHQH